MGNKARKKLKKEIMKKRPIFNEIDEYQILILF